MWFIRFSFSQLPDNFFIFQFFFILVPMMDFSRRKKQNKKIVANSSSLLSTCMCWLLWIRESWTVCLTMTTLSLSRLHLARGHSEDVNSIFFYDFRMFARFFFIHPSTHSNVKHILQTLFQSNENESNENVKRSNDELRATRRRCHKFHVGDAFIYRIHIFPYYLYSFFLCLKKILRS